MLQLNYRDAKPIYEQIKEGIQKLLFSNAILADEKLPSVRELASNLAINPNTIQRAYRELEAEGYLYTRKGKGTFAAPMEPLKEAKKEELCASFDHVVTELFLMSVTKEELCLRMDDLEQRGSER